MFLGARAAKIRIARGLLQQDVAEEIPVSRETVVHWENGTAMPSRTNERRLAVVLECDEDDFKRPPEAPIPRRIPRYEAMGGLSDFEDEEVRPND